MMLRGFFVLLTGCVIGGCSPTLKPVLILKCEGCYVHQADIEEAYTQSMEAVEREAEGERNGIE